MSEYVTGPTADGGATRRDLMDYQAKHDAMIERVAERALAHTVDAVAEKWRARAAVTPGYEDVARAPLFDLADVRGILREQAKAAVATGYGCPACIDHTAPFLHTCEPRGRDAFVTIQCDGDMESVFETAPSTVGDCFKASVERETKREQRRHCLHLATEAGAGLSVVDLAHQIEQYLYPDEPKEVKITASCTGAPTSAAPTPEPPKTFPRRPMQDWSDAPR